MTEQAMINKLWKIVRSHKKMDKQSIIQSMADHLAFSLGKNEFTTKEFDIFESLALAIRDRLIDRWNDTQQTYHRKKSKRVYYFSLEYLMGRSLGNSLINLGIYPICQQVLQGIGYDLSAIEELEYDAGLGNGGLGRLAACFLDSMATLQLPAYGYGIRYEYGIFYQAIEQGGQTEYPDNWLSHGYPWEIPRWEVVFPIHFYGRVEEHEDVNGEKKHRWVGAQEMLAMAYDVPIPGFNTMTVNTLRLWQSKPVKEFDFHLFNSGDYMQAIVDAQQSETISKVLYPNDKGFSGKELRLKQQYFFVSASLQDMLRRFKEDFQNLYELPDHVAIQLNDTHPSIAIPELMRLLMDVENMEWEPAWSITIRIFAYTNHTVLPEALEKWSIALMEHLLPRHLQIIFQINHLFLHEVKKQFPNDPDLLSRVSLIEEGEQRSVRMPHLAIVGSHTINGVSSIHSELLKTRVFKDFYTLYPQRFQNKTNGITPRRWLNNANPELTKLISDNIGTNWITQLQQLDALIPLAEEGEFQQSWRDVKELKKRQLTEWIARYAEIEVDPHSMFDVQIKRIHEYKRQLMNLLHVITLYNRIRANPSANHVPRTVIFGGKAAPGYYMAKLIIRLMIDVARVVNRDPTIANRLKVVFVENYGVSLAEKIIPATDVSEHISTAGTEASGTSNMKFALNGALIIGTLDGANIEIKEEIGEDNIFTFGLTVPEIQRLYADGYNPRTYYQHHPELRETLEMINTGFFNRDHVHLYHDIYNSLIYDDHYLLFADFDSYVKCQERVAETYQNQDVWTRMSILSTARMGKFSSDRTIREYAKDIWKIDPVIVESHND